MKNECKGLRAATAKLGRGLMYVYMRVCYRPKVIYLNKEGRKEKDNEPVIYVANHTGHHDGQVSAMLFKNSALLIARDWYEKKIVKWITTGGNFIPIDRFGLDTGWLRDGSQMLRDGKNVIIFPEGHTSKNGQINEFKSGFVMLSVLTGCRIVPVFIDGEYHHICGKRLRVYEGAPMELTPEGKGMNAEYLKSESERFRKIIEDIKNNERKRAH